MNRRSCTCHGRRFLSALAADNAAHLIGGTSHPCEHCAGHHVDAPAGLLARLVRGVHR